MEDPTDDREPQSRPKSEPRAVQSVRPISGLAPDKVQSTGRTSRHRAKPLGASRRAPESAGLTFGSTHRFPATFRTSTRLRRRRERHRRRRTEDVGPSPTEGGGPPSEGHGRQTAPSEEESTPSPEDREHRTVSGGGIVTAPEDREVRPVGLRLDFRRSLSV